MAAISLSRKELGFGLVPQPNRVGLPAVFGFLVGLLALLVALDFGRSLAFGFSPLAV